MELNNTVTEEPVPKKKNRFRPGLAYKLPINPVPRDQSRR